MKTVQERQQEERDRKLADIQRQLDEGTLKIRKMTPEERKANPPQPRTPGAPRSRTRSRAPSS